MAAPAFIMLELDPLGAALERTRVVPIKQIVDQFSRRSEAAISGRRIRAPSLRRRRVHRATERVTASTSASRRQ